MIISKFQLGVVVLALVGAIATAPRATAQAWRDDPVEIQVLSSRADLVSGGDALIQVRVPERADPAAVTVRVDGQDVTDRFAIREGGQFMGLLDGLEVGRTRLVATLPDGSGAHLDLVNHPIGGPVFSGPQTQPFVCYTEQMGLGPAVDDQCNAPTSVEFFYKHAATGTFEPYDPAAPPAEADIAVTTTDQDVTMPYIVRHETGTINRAVYVFAVLADPAAPWEPWAPQAGWNHKVFYHFGGGANPSRHQGVPVGALDDKALSRGWAVASSSLNTLGNTTNTTVSGETVMMVKEHIVEEYGQIRFTLGEGGSGGSVQQDVISNAYPGILDGIIPSATFQDLWTTANEVSDCRLLLRYFNETSPHLWPAETQKAAVTGHFATSVCEYWVDTWEFDNTMFDPRHGCYPQSTPLPSLTLADPEWAYDPETNPTGARCTLSDDQRSIFGPRPEARWGPVEAAIGTGFANRPLDNIGVQYGLSALLDGTILPEQFVDLNEQVGGMDVDADWTSERTQADPAALSIAYRTGLVNDARAMASVPILDGPATANVELHTNVRSYILRARLDEANGSHDNHVQWTLGPVADTTGFLLMDRWLSAIEADTGDDPLATKVVRNKPEDAVDACWINDQMVTDQAVCQTAFPYYRSTRMAAGGPFIDDVMKCQLTPLRRADYYDIQFTDAQWTRLQEAFPDGVCDWSLPGVGSQPSVQWLSFAEGPGGQPLGSPPVSVPFGPDGPQPLLTRHGGANRIETAVAVSGVGVELAGTVVVARADAYADALAGAPLAAHLGAPLLLSASDRLDEATADEIRRLGATQAILLGGEAALGSGVADDLVALGLQVRRLAGTNRFGTAAAIAAELPPTGEVLLASGEGFADAVSASGLGATTGSPVLFTEPARLPPETAEMLDADTAVSIVGGEAIIEPDVEDAARALAGDVGRLAGATRYATSAAVAGTALARGGADGIVWVATGRDFPDARVAGAAAGRDGGVLLLVDGRDIDGAPESLGWLLGHATSLDAVRLAGGHAALSPEVEGGLAALLS